MKHRKFVSSLNTGGATESLATHSNLTRFVQSINRAGASKSKRSHLGINAEILKALLSNELTVNQLTRYLNLNTRMTKTSMDELLAKGFVVTNHEKRFTTYSATPLGARWLNTYLIVIKG